MPYLSPALATSNFSISTPDEIFPSPKSLSNILVDGVISVLTPSTNELLQETLTKISLAVVPIEFSAKLPSRTSQPTLITGTLWPGISTVNSNTMGVPREKSLSLFAVSLWRFPLNLAVDQRVSPRHDETLIDTRLSMMQLDDSSRGTQIGKISLGV